MGFLDKAAAKVGEATKAAQEGIADQQAKRKADGLLRELGAWTYAKHKGGFDDADTNIARVLGELAAHEAEHGELGAKEEEPPRPAASAARCPAASARGHRPGRPAARPAGAARAPGPAGAAAPARPRAARAAGPARAPGSRPARPARTTGAEPGPAPAARAGRPGAAAAAPRLSSSMIKVGVFGAAGRMGRTVCEAVAADPDLELVAAVDPLHAGHRPAVGSRRSTAPSRSPPRPRRWSTPAPRSSSTSPWPTPPGRTSPSPPSTACTPSSARPASTRPTSPTIEPRSPRARASSRPTSPSARC